MATGATPDGPKQIDIGEQHAGRDVVNNVANHYAGPSAKPGDKTNFPSAGVARNASFVGRGQELTALHKKVVRGAVAVFHAVTSDGGFGKSQLAIEYAFRHRKYFADGVWFIDTSSGANADRDGRNILVALDEPVPAESDAVAGRVSQALSRGGRHLLILDDVQDLPAARRQYALANPARLLITTRRRVLAGEGFEPFPLDVLDPNDAVDLLQQGRDDLAAPQHRGGLLAVVGHLHLHALAVALAGGFLRLHPYVFPDDLLERLKAAPVGSARDLLEGVKPDSAAAGYRRGVAVTLALHLPTLGRPTDAADHLCQQILAAASLVDPRSIPPDLLLACGRTPDAEASALNPDAALAQLVDVSVLRYGGAGGGTLLNIHGLTQQMVNGRLGATEQGRALLAQAAVALRDALLAAFSFTANSDHSRWPGLDRLSPHAEALLAPNLGQHAEPDWARLCSQVGYFADSVRHRLDDALRLYREAERIDRAALGDDHPSVATDVSNIGGVLRVCGDLTGALAKYQEAERIDRAAYGDGHPEVATDVNNIGGVLLDGGDLPGALFYFQEAERIDRAALGDDQPNVAIRVNNIGSVLLFQGDLIGALAKYEEAERIDRAARGNDHPDVATDVNNIGNVLQAQGDLAGALLYFQEAERIDRAALGNGHPSVARDINNIGGVLRALGDPAGARAKCEEALDILLRAYGPRGENVVTTVANLLSVGADPIERARRVVGDAAAEVLRAELAKRSAG